MTKRAFTLIEIVMTIVILGIIGSVAVIKIGSMVENSRIEATKNEMMMIKKAIVGDPSIVSGGKMVSRGFYGDVGKYPSNLKELAKKPSGVPTYNKITRIGWNGPYIEATDDFLKDAWDEYYNYGLNGNGTGYIESVGGSEKIKITFGTPK